MNSYPVGISLS